MNENDDLLKQADGVFRFIRENLNKQDISNEEFATHIPQLIEKLSEFLEQYKKSRGVSIGEVGELIESNQIEQWEDMIGVFKKVGEIVWNIDKQFPESEKELADELELDTDMNALKLLFIGIILKKSKKRKKEKEEKKEVKINKLPEMQDKIKHNKLRGSLDVFEKFEQFVNEEITELQEIYDNMSLMIENKKQFIESYKEIIPWNLIYYTAELRLEEENKPRKIVSNRDVKDLKELSKNKNYAIKVLMKYYYDYEKRKEEYKIR